MTGVHWEVADEWFGMGGENTELPVVLSPTIEVLTESDEAPCESTGRSRRNQDL